MKAVKVLVALALVIVVGAVLIDTMNRSNDPPPPLPEPNGYSVLLALAKRLPDNGVNSRETDPGKLTEAIEPHRAVLDESRAALALSSRVPVKLSLAPEDAQRNMEEMAAFKRLAGLHIADIRLKTIRRQHSAAAAAAVDLVRLARHVSHGGFLLHHLVGRAFESTALEELGRTAQHLTGVEKKETAAELNEIWSSVETPSEVLRRERQFRKLLPFPQRIVLTLMRPFRDPMKPLETNYLKKCADMDDARRHVLKTLNAPDTLLPATAAR